MTKWLDRSLLQGPYLALVTNEKDFARCKKDMGVECQDMYCNPNANATTHTYISKDGSIAAIVGINLKAAQGREGIGIAALLVHEAVHVWQQVRATITYTTDPQRTGGLEAELEAYAIQNIAQNLMHAYVKTREYQI